MIEGLEKTCKMYPHIEARLHSLKLDIQKVNYLSEILAEPREDKNHGRGAPDGVERRHRQGFDPECYVEMMRYHASFNLEGHRVDLGFKLT